MTDSPHSPHSPLSRREFVAGSAAVALGAAAPMIVPRHVLGRGYRAPSDRLNVAVIGVGGWGMNDAMRLLDENLVAMCDVDFPFVERTIATRRRPRPLPEPPAALPAARVPAWRAERAAEADRLARELPLFAAAYEKATRYADYRALLAAERDLDAVVIATPDHTHAVIAAAALRAGKHVYLQKPLTYTVAESRALARLAAERPALVTQMGNQGHSAEGTRRIRELVAANLIGAVREVHVWTDRPQRYWAQGIPRPGTPPGALDDPLSATTRWNVATLDGVVLKALGAGATPPPPGLAWDLFLGPAPAIPFHPAYHPSTWRGWVGFGGGAIGDMGAHLINQPYWALDLGHPTTVSASSTAWGGAGLGVVDGTTSYPLAMTVRYEFPARGARPPVTLHWYDGGLLPPRPRFLPEDVTLPPAGGGVFVGERGILVYETHGANPTVYPTRLAAAAADVPRRLLRAEGSHQAQWVRACRGEEVASAPFAYAARLTEVMLLGIVALRTGPGALLRYDGAAMRVTNVPEANRLLTRDYRAGWTL